jgi:peptidoglycan/LPS O-acetylase OafA/YrhL
VRLLLLVVVAALGIAAGASAGSLGEADDSPGLQLVGVVIVAAVVVYAVRVARRG